MSRHCPQYQAQPPATAMAPKREHCDASSKCCQGFPADVCCTRPTMTYPLLLVFPLLFTILNAIASPLQPVEPPRRPLVVWHGLGDSYASPGMLEFVQLIKEMHPGIFVHSVYIDEDLEADQKAGFVSLLVSMGLCSICT